MSIESVKFRQAEPVDVSGLALVLERANAQRTGNPIPVSIESGQSVDFLHSRMNRIRASTYVAVMGEEVAGFAISHPLIDLKSPNIETYTEHLSQLMLDPDYWGRRIASKLLDLITGHARDTGKRYLDLWTQADNSHAQAVYAHRGFILTGFQRKGGEGKEVQYQLDL